MQRSSEVSRWVITGGNTVAKNFKDLVEQEILALAISSEETDARIYADFAAGLKVDYPATSQIFEEIEAEENEHRRQLIDDYRRRFGEHIPLVRREDVKGFVHRKPAWMIRPLGIKAVRRQAELMETETRRFYERAASKVSDASTRKLLGDLADAERKHVTLADNLQQEHLTPKVEAKEDKAHRRLFVLQIVQPGLIGLMDGSVSTLAPVFCGSLCNPEQSRRLLGGPRR
jgi:rubrerythrin